MAPEELNIESVGFCETIEISAGTSNRSAVEPMWLSYKFHFPLFTHFQLIYLFSLDRSQLWAFTKMAAMFKMERGRPYLYEMLQLAATGMTVIQCTTIGRLS